MAPLFTIVSSEVLIEKQWIGATKRSACEAFWEIVTQASSKLEVEPVIATAHAYFIHTTRNDLFFLTIASREVQPLFVLELQQRIIETFNSYFYDSTESSMRENFSLVYQLLDEMVDAGAPFTVENNQLMDMILPPTVANRVLSAIGSSSGIVRDDTAIGMPSRTPWRRNDVKYLTNKIYFDLDEQLDMIIDANEQIVSATIHGELNVISELAGMPDISLTLVPSAAHIGAAVEAKQAFTRRGSGFASMGSHTTAEEAAKLALEDVTLHRCVRLARYERDRVLSFVPPDGRFTLMTYRIRNTNIQTPLYVKPMFTWHPTSCRFQVQVGLKYGVKVPVTNIVITIPFPKSILSSSASANLGTAKIDQLTKVLRWEIPELSPTDNKIPLLTGTLGLDEAVAIEERPIIRVGFEANKFSASGLNVGHIEFKNVSYEPGRWAKSKTKAGKYQVRTN